MKTELIDQLTKTQEELKNALHTHGIHRIFEQRGKLIVQESDEVQVKVIYKDGRNIVKLKFPQIGNTFQIITTIVFIVTFLLLNVPFSFVLAILLGQAAAFAMYYPRINRLKKKVEHAIR
jgi:hypothetical protein